MEFSQKYFWFETKAKIVEGGVEFYSKDRTKSNQYFVPFEQLASRAERQAYYGIYMPLWLIVVLFIGIFPLVSLLRNSAGFEVFVASITGLAMISLAVVFYAIETKERNFYLLKGQEHNIFFYLDVPSERVVYNFVNKIFEKRGEYLVSTYGFIDKDRSREDNLGRIMWLKDNGVITPERYLQLKAELERVFYGSNPIGFLPRDSSSSN